jgi:hypothetical protein
MERQWLTWLGQRPGNGTPATTHLSPLKQAPEATAMLIALLRELLPEGKPVYLTERGIHRLPLYQLNQLLQPLGLVIKAQKVRDPKRFVTCMDQDGQTEQYGLFTLETLAEEENNA